MVDNSCSSVLVLPFWDREDPPHTRFLARRARVHVKLPGLGVYVQVWWLAIDGCH